MSVEPSKELRNAHSHEMANELRHELQRGLPSPEFLDRLKNISNKTTRIEIALQAIESRAVLSVVRHGGPLSQLLSSARYFLERLETLKGQPDSPAALQAAADDFNNQILRQHDGFVVPNEIKDLALEVFQMSRTPQVETDPDADDVSVLLDCVRRVEAWLATAKVVPGPVDSIHWVDDIPALGKGQLPEIRDFEEVLLRHQIGDDSVSLKEAATKFAEFLGKDQMFKAFSEREAIVGRISQVTADALQAAPSRTHDVPAWIQETGDYIKSLQPPSAPDVAFDSSGSIALELDPVVRVDQKAREYFRHQLALFLEKIAGRSVDSYEKKKFALKALRAQGLKLWQTIPQSLPQTPDQALASDYQAYKDALKEFISEADKLKDATLKISLVAMNTAFDAAFQLPTVSEDA